MTRYCTEGLNTGHAYQIKQIHYECTIHINHKLLQQIITTQTRYYGNTNNQMNLRYASQEVEIYQGAYIYNCL